jgi:hypothetical protein
MSRTLPLAPLIFLAPLLTGCAHGDKYNAYEASLEPAARDQPFAPAPPGSLFWSDKAVLSNEEIGRIFDLKVTPPAKARLAILRLGNTYLPYAPEVAALERTAVNDVLARFRGSPRVSHAMVMPSMLTPPQMTIPYMREAAARLQADTLMVYRTATQIYGRSRAFAADETRAYCTVEGVLLDTRSGIITSTAVATEQFSARRRSNDLTFRETMQRAEQEAISRALLKVATELAGYLDSAPPPDGTRDNRPAAPVSREARALQFRHGHGRTEARGRRVRARGRPASVA